MNQPRWQRDFSYLFVSAVVSLVILVKVIKLMISMLVLFNYEWPQISNSLSRCRELVILNFCYFDCVRGFAENTRDVNIVGMIREDFSLR